MKKIVSMLPDALMICGACSISYGAWMVYPAAGFLAAGSFLILAGILLARSA